MGDGQAIIPASGNGDKNQRLSEHLPKFLTSALVDLRSCDLRIEAGVDASHASPNHAAAEEAHDVNDLALLGELFAAVLVELVDRVGRILRDE